MKLTNLVLGVLKSYHVDMRRLLHGHAPEEEPIPSDKKGRLSVARNRPPHMINKSPFSLSHVGRQQDLNNRESCLGARRHLGTAPRSHGGPADDTATAEKRTKTSNRRNFSSVHQSPHHVTARTLVSCGAVRRRERQRSENENLRTFTGGFRARRAGGGPASNRTDTKPAGSGHLVTAAVLSVL